MVVIHCPPDLNSPKVCPVHDDTTLIAHTRAWVEQIVIDLNLCPFAQRELIKNRVRFSVTHATSEAGLIEALQEELMFLAGEDRVETTLLIHPRLYESFYDYNDFLGIAEGLLIELELEGIFQIASFHPKYQFAGTDRDDPENFTNRSPYPMLHLLREDSLEAAIDAHPDVDAIPDANIALMNELGTATIKAKLAKCLDL